jgi:hypothetical protein
VDESMTRVGGLGDAGELELVDVEWKVGGVGVAYSLSNYLNESGNPLFLISLSINFPESCNDDKLAFRFSLSSSDRTLVLQLLQAFEKKRILNSHPKQIKSKQTITNSPYVHPPPP